MQSMRRFSSVKVRPSYAFSFAVSAPRRGQKSCGLIVIDFLLHQSVRRFLPRAGCLGKMLTPQCKTAVRFVPQAREFRLSSSGGRPDK